MQMQEAFVSMAVMEPFEGQEEEFLQTLAQLYELMRSKNYSRNDLFRKAEDPHTFINVRYWTSEEARQNAHEDPEVHRYWARLGHLCIMRRIHETLEKVDLFPAAVKDLQPKTD
jgi:quinol monooxygenase YgiN